MEDRDWKIIKVLSTEKNITKAARLLYMSQPALTSRLRQIEQEFDVQIVNRSTKGIEFTPEGEVLAEVAEDFIHDLDQIKDKVRQYSHKNAGTLSIAASNYFTLYTLPGILKLFKEKYPETNYKVMTDWSKDIFSMIYAQKAHVGFASVDYGGLKNIHFLYEEPICITYTHPFEFKDLPKLPRIVYQSDYLLQTRLDKWWRDNFSIPPHISMHVDKLANCKEMVKHGLGYALLPQRIIQDIPDKHKLFLTDSNGEKITRKTWMLYTDQATCLPIVRSFIDFIKQIKF